MGAERGHAGPQGPGEEPGRSDTSAYRLRIVVSTAAALAGGFGLVVAFARPDWRPAGLVAVAAALVMLVAAQQPSGARPVMDVLGGILGAGTNAVLVALTGGAMSPFVPLFGITPLVAATIPVARPLVGFNLLLMVAGLASPYLYDTIPSWYPLQVLGYSGMWTVGAVATYRIVSRMSAQREQLEAADRTRRLFLRAITHELRRPLTVLRGNVELLTARGEGLDPDARTELYGALDRQSGRLERLLGDLFDIDRLEGGAEMLDLAPLRLDEFVRDVVTAIDPGDHQIELGTVSEVTVPADRAKLERVLENLVVNAIRHTPSPGRIRLSTRTDVAGGAVVVEDDGPGIPPELREDVFRPFVRGPQSAEGDVDGTGVGLSLVRQIVALHGGDVHLDDSARLGGARFTVWLPFAEGD